MLETVTARVKPQVLVAAGFCGSGTGFVVRTGDAGSDCSSFFIPPHAVTLPSLTWILVAAGVVVLLAVVFRLNAPRRRARAVRELLDAADALEARLRTARAEIAAVAGDQGPDPVGDALREMLRQRLWLRDHSREASLAQLAEVRASIDAARARIDAQLAKIAQARAPRA